MPGFRGHLIGGTVTYLAILQCIKSMQPSIPVIISGFIFCIIGSLFPDIDIKSKGQKLFYQKYRPALLSINLFLQVCCLALLPIKTTLKLTTNIWLDLEKQFLRKSRSDLFRPFRPCWCSHQQQ